eukprot:COSAG03_NODE_3100_length_2221_cov_4.713478_3_plen_47_part_00
MADMSGKCLCATDLELPGEIEHGQPLFDQRFVQPDKLCSERQRISE